ncbi:MAG: type III-B CRISPR module RAMP protein Cmr4 [Pirellulaceae bacterium]|jgi:CRISPR-associated protein Cmr4|nr:type III-B CRISPR module RAMP protein Cmr4 [Thermoguttaceae bacterium]NLZ01089.1 type III-B CRISPR module RAMP protein Cmr4 [Pirellulaceae bacterium]
MRNIQNNRQATAILFLHAQTPLHPGSGTALGVVDLPVQRERHTQWPLIPGSSLKGVLRDACRRNSGDDDRLFSAFGPDAREADKHAGAISLTDARILAFPVRSLRGVFAWVTCPAVLERLHRDAALAGFGNPLPAGLPAPEGDCCACAQGSPLLVENDRLVLEEFELRRTEDCGPLADWIAQHGLADDFTRTRFQSHLVIVGDDHFTHFVRHATEVVARIGLDSEKKTVKRGALFYQEFLPAETLFYALVFANPSRREGHVNDAAGIMEYAVGGIPNVLQIGGDETTGKGFCAVRFNLSQEGTIA